MRDLRGETKDGGRGHAARLRGLALAALVALLAGPAGAAQIHVTTGSDGNPADDGLCTLREAVLVAREFAPNDDCGPLSGGDDEIVFDVATVNLTVGSMQFSTNIKLTGPATIDGTGNADERLFLFASGGHLTLDQMTLTGFNPSTASGGVIDASVGDLTIVDSSFTNNQTLGNGGAIYFTGDTLTITGSSFTGNQAEFDGGALYFNPDVAVTISDTAFDGNTAGRDGGAINIFGTGALATVTLTGVTFNGNTANGDGTSEVRGGGAIFNDGGDTSTSLILIQGSTFTANSAPNGRGGALINAPTAAIAWPDVVNTPVDLHTGGLYNCLFLQNTASGTGGLGGVNGLGGAIYNGGNLTVLGSTFDQNTSVASGGGAIAHLTGFGLEHDRLRVANSTFSGNQALTDGGAISNFSDNAKVLLLNTTISGSLAAGSGGALYNANSAVDAVQVGNSILANSVGASNCGGQALADLGGNLQFPGSSCGATFQTGDPQLLPLTPNAPPIQPTMALGGSSAALGLGVPSICTAAPIFNLDQRLLPRPQGPGNCDAGAFESPAPPPVPGYGSSPSPGSVLAAIGTTVNVLATRTFTVSETGSAQLNVTAVSITGGPELSIAPGSFSIPDGGGPVIVTISCQSAAPGTFDGTVTVQHNAPGSPASYTIQCTVDPAPAPGYGSVPAPGSPLLPITTTTGLTGSSSFLVSETGNAQLNVTSVSMSPGDPVQLQVLPGSFAIPDGGVPVTVTVTCTSPSSGTFGGTVQVVHDAAGSPASYPVNCTVNPVAAPGYGSSPAPGQPLAINTVTSSTGTATLTVSETGNAQLDVTSVTLLAGSAPELSVPPGSFSIPDGGAPVDLTVSCLSASTGTFNGTLRVQHNAAGSPADYPVSCNVGPASAPGYGSSPAPGSTLAPLGTTPGVAVPRTFTVSETGNAPLVVSSVTVSGGPALTVGPPSFNIPDGGGPVTVTVQCLSASVGVFGGTVTVTHNAAGSPASYPVSCSVHPPGTHGDLNQDQTPDLVFRSQSTGALSVWIMSGINIVQQTTTTPSTLADLNWKLQGTADLNGDGHTDLIWRQALSGKNVVWFMNQTTRTSGVFLNPDTLADQKWQIAGTGQFDGDGKWDLLWRNSVSGRNVVWTMDGVNRLAGQFTTPDTQPVDWQVAGTGDFDGDQKTDILWQRTTDGFMTVWFMDGLVRTGQADITPQLAPLAQGGWRIYAVEDYDGNGRPDLVFRNSQSGRLAIWFMDATGITRLSGAFTSPQNLPPLDLKIVGPR